MTIGKRIRKRRLALNMSVEELAKLLGRNRATVYRYEKGDIENLPIDVLEPLAKALDTTPQYLMGWTDKPEIPTTDIASLLVRYFKSSARDPLDGHLANLFDMWIKEFDDVTFTETEFEKILEYGRFLVSQRTD